MQQATVFLLLLGVAYVSSLQCPGINCCPPPGSKEVPPPEDCHPIDIPTLKDLCEKQQKFPQCTGHGSGVAVPSTGDEPSKDDTTSTTTRKPGKVIALEAT